MSKASDKAEMRAEAVVRLGKLGVVPGAKIYTCVKHVSASGMSRRISLYIVCPTTRTNDRGRKETTHEIVDITGSVAHVLDYKRHKDGGVVVGGCGMDMGFHVVYNLGRVLFPKGAPLAFTSHGRRHQAKQAAKLAGKRATTETDGGYLLKQEWL
jgi:hypothetical protein